MTDFESEWRNDIFTPVNPAFMAEQFVAAIQKPNLFPESSRNPSLHNYIKGSVCFYNPYTTDNNT
jgi:hypothetical protein